jgi:hypothetical protein
MLGKQLNDIRSAQGFSRCFDDNKKYTITNCGYIVETKSFIKRYITGDNKNVGHKNKIKDEKGRPTSTISTDDKKIK